MLRAAASKTSKFGLAWVLAAAALAGPTLVHSRDASPQITATVSVAELPAAGRETYRSIQRGGPFPHDKDGSVFGNRERLLPAERRGYYREYTVRTPGSRDRGALRIVCGGPPRQPDACFYTADHYASFRRITE